MMHLGDISKINGAEIEPVDIITFGSPCQDLSMAGKRAGIKHEASGDGETTRSGLFMEAVRIIREMREATHGKYPTFALWENVPGAFSSNKGEDFRIVLEELIKISEPCAVMPAVPAKGWAYADSYIGDGWSIAYRVFDTQYWPRTPQRRKRIHLVADFRGQRAGEVLFERESLRGNFAPDGEKRKTTTAGTRSCPAGDRQRRTYILDQIGGKFEYGKESQVNGTLCAGNRAAIAYSTDNGDGLIVRRLTPTECARLQGFADRWGDIEPKDDLKDEEFHFWLDVRNTHATVNGRTARSYSKKQMLTWYNKLHNDGAECKMWGNGIALPPALYCMQGIAEALREERENA